MRRILVSVLAMLCFSAAFTRAEETPAELEAKGIAALKASQTNADQIVAAAIFFGKAADSYDKAHLESKATDMNSYLYWCKKKMTYQQIDAFLKANDAAMTAVAKRMKDLESAAPKADDAKLYFDRAETFAKAHPDEHLLIAIRFYEIADRFKGSGHSLEAQDRSLREMTLSAKPAASEPAPQPAAARVIPGALKGWPENLLKRIDLATDVLQGEWTLENGKLVSASQEFRKLQLPVKPSQEFDLHLVLAYESGENIGCILPTAKGPVAFLFQNKAGFAGLGKIDGKNPDKNPSGVAYTLRNNSDYDLTLQVRRGSIRAFLGGKELLKYEFTDAPFSLSEQWKMRSETGLGIYHFKTLASYKTIEIVDSGASFDKADFAAPAPSVSPSPAASVKKIPVPDSAQQKAAEKIIREIFQAEFADAAPGSKLALAGKLQAQAAQTADDPAGRYMLLILAANLSAESGDLDAMYAVLDTLAATYEGDFSTATKFALGLAVANTKDANLSKLALAFKILVDKPDDGAACLLAGKYLCFVKGDYDRGIPLLAKSPHPALSKIAKLDLARPDQPPAQIALGDAWWELGDKDTEKAEKQKYLERAAFWYLKALPSMSGLTKAKLEKRIEVSGAKK